MSSNLKPKNIANYKILVVICIFIKIIVLDYTNSQEVDFYLKALSVSDSQGIESFARNDLLLESLL